MQVEESRRYWCQVLGSVGNKLGKARLKQGCIRCSQPCTICLEFVHVGGIPLFNSRLFNTARDKEVEKRDSVRITHLSHTQSRTGPWRYKVG